MTTDSQSRMMETTTTTQSSLLAEGERDYGNFSILHIILISFGGVVFIIGVVVIIVLLKSRRKLCAGSSSSSGGGRSGGGGSAGGVRNTRHAPVFIIGASSRQGRGGDNPAFCRSDEVNGGGLPSSVSGAASASRLPTYEEVMSGRAPTAPLAGSQQRSNIRVSQLQREREAATQSQAEPERVSRSHSETPPPRYAYEYPSCFWEEVPPPPYPSGNYGVVRAMGGLRGSTRGQEERRAGGGALAARNSPPSRPARAPLAVPTPTVLSPAQSPALLPRNHTLTSSGRALPTSAPPPSPLPAVGGAEMSRPLASSSPAVPRRQPTPAPMAVPSQLDYFMSVGGVQSSHPQGAASSSRLEVQRGHGHCHGNNAVSQERMTGPPSAPIASFDIEL